uniref:Shisa N-terminal domain-containing protein n=1 Tax=Leptobrachium leishanense TaxID=445787 RepID=A0A8C5R3T1_9ANUR
MKGLRAILCYFVGDLFTLLCWAQGKGGQHFGSTVVVSDVNLSNPGDIGSTDPNQTAEGCRGYFDVMGQWDPPFNCSSGEFLYCCGTCGFRYCCKFKQSKLDQSICTNYDRPNWLAPGKTPPKIDDPLLDPNRDKANLIVYIICGVVAVMVLVGIFTKLGLEKAHRPQRENMSRCFVYNCNLTATDVMSIQQGVCRSGVPLLSPHYCTVFYYRLLCHRDGWMWKVMHLQCVHIFRLHSFFTQPPM